MLGVVSFPIRSFTRKQDGASEHGLEGMRGKRIAGQMMQRAYCA
jgi:hypothetical protein